MKRAKCKSCGASIIWCRSAAGNMAPIDADPVTDGNIAIYPCEEGETPTYTVVHGDMAETMLPTDRHKNHFATCPSSAQHRKPKEPA